MNGAFTSAFAFVVGGAILYVHVPAHAVAPIALVIVIAAASCTGLGLLVAAIGFVARETATLNIIMFAILLIFTGANVALDDLPRWMSALAQGMPLTHAIEAARKLAEGASVGSVGGLLAAEALVGAACAVLGYWLIRFIERQSRVHATLERT